MVTHPEAQHKAHAEIDSVVGEDRTPIWDDWDDLPYVRQIQKEVLRWDKSQQSDIAMN